MRVVFKTRFPVPFFRIVIFCLLSLSSAFYYLYKNIDNVDHKSRVDASALMGFSPIINTFSFDVPRPDSAAPRTIFVEKNQTFSELMALQDLDADTVDQMYSSARELYDLRQIRSGKNILLEKKNGLFHRMEYPIDPFQTLVISSEDGSIRSDIVRHAVETQVEELGGQIEGSLYSSLNRLGEGDELVIKFADIFEWDVDFVRELRAGDSFKIIYEREYVQGRPYGYGKILAAELVNREKRYVAIGTQRGKNWEYFGPEGKAMRKAFLASPLKFNRISSGFTPRRFHPITKTFRPHYGIDYAAPSGTPVRTIGTGKVIFAGWAGGAGKTIKIQHNKEVTTVYCHLSRYASGIKKGASVSQGQVVGYVGSTGMSTAPHLDFRYIKNGKYVNFLTVKGAQDEPLSPSELIRFKNETREMAARLENLELKERSLQLVYTPRTTAQFTEATY